MMSNTHLCDNCGERLADEVWDYSDAPIPNPPEREYLCVFCADTRREAHAERMAEEQP